MERLGCPPAHATCWRPWRAYAALHLWTWETAEPGGATRPDSATRPDGATTRPEGSTGSADATRPAATTGSTRATGRVPVAVSAAGRRLAGMRNFRCSEGVTMSAHGPASILVTVLDTPIGP